MNSGSTNFDLILGDTTNGGGFTSSNRPLPSSTTITNYFSPGHTTYTPTLILTDSVQQPLSEDFTVSINSLVATPEPSSLLIVGLTVATGALGFSVVSRLKRRKA